MPQAFLVWDTGHVLSTRPCCDDHRQPRRCGQSCSPGCTGCHRVTPCLGVADPRGPSRTHLAVVLQRLVRATNPKVRRGHARRHSMRADSRLLDPSPARPTILLPLPTHGRPIPKSVAAASPSLHACGQPTFGSVAGAPHHPPATPYARATEPTRRRERTSDGEYGPRGCRPRAFRCVLASRAPRPARLPPTTGTFHAAGCVSFRAGAFDAVGDSNPVPHRVICPRPHRNVPARAGCPRPLHLAGRPWIPSHWYGEWAGPDYRCSQ